MGRLGFGTELAHWFLIKNRFVKTVFLLLFVFLVVGAFWYRAEYVVVESGPVESLNETDRRSGEILEGAVAASAEKEMLLIEDVEPQGTGVETRAALLEEYWASLLVTQKGPDWSPSQRVDELIELQRLLGLNPEEAFDYLSSLMDLPEVDPAAKAFYATLLLARLGTLQPEEAMAYLLETDHAFSVEDYENVVRLWMDQEGVSVMDWFLANEVPALKPELIAPFISVFAEEDPYGFMLQYQALDTDGLYTGRALELLYNSYGSEIYETLSQEAMTADALVMSFEYVGTRLVSEDPDFAREWLMQNRFNVDVTATATVARQVIAADVASGQSSAEAALDWGLKNQLILPYDQVVFDTIDQVSDRSVDEAIDVILALQKNYGESMSYLSDLLPVDYQSQVAGSNVVEVTDDLSLADDAPAEEIPDN